MRKSKPLDESRKSGQTSRTKITIYSCKIIKKKKIRKFVAILEKFHSSLLE
ncbi:hypothetical protein HanPSC8_Chr10g0448531 [Helianthus annuus]|nr:hypothetical protein HanPSC8_Chr10g0448531 [Helianthus annuus]